MIFSMRCNLNNQHCSCSDFENDWKMTLWEHTMHTTLLRTLSWFSYSKPIFGKAYST